MTSLHVAVHPVSSTSTSSGSTFGRELQRKCACGGAHAECASCRDEKETVKRRSISGSTRPEVPSVVHDVLRSPGQALEPVTRAFVESRFAHDFSQVRVHTDTKDAESARAVGAEAYTVGQNIVFGEGRYTTGDQRCLALLAHELAH